MMVDNIWHKPVLTYAISVVISSWWQWWIWWIITK